MKDKKIEFAEEQLDYIREVMNIGAGNAGTALEQMIGFKTEVTIPVVKSYRHIDIQVMYQHIGESTNLVTAVRMNLVGQVTGKIVFVVPDKNLALLTSSVETATTGRKKITKNLDLSVVAEIGNILAGTYLTALHDFCMLNIYHSIPKIQNEPLKALLLELFPKDDAKNAKLVLVFNQLITVADQVITTYILLVPDNGSMERIAQSVRQAKDKLSLP
ncbi:MAG: chemotaxis protein CheC [Methanoregula sp.]|jgi:chemotaxis protein CheC|nr:chemotaxis protein CheC [Methanoregula sp.]